MGRVRLVDPSRRLRGPQLYSSQPEYTGLVALDPIDGGHAVISTDADPTTGAPQVSGTDGRRHFELYDGRRQPDGSYRWTPLTAHSQVENIRPVLAVDPGGARALIWLRGRYTISSDFDMRVVGVVTRADGSLVAASGDAPCRPVVPGIATPRVLSTAAVPLAWRFGSHPADDLLLYRPGGPGTT